MMEDMFTAWAGACGVSLSGLYARIGGISLRFQPPENDENNRGMNGLPGPSARGGREKVKNERKLQNLTDDSEQRQEMKGLKVQATERINSIRG